MVTKTTSKSNIGLAQITAGAITPDQLIPYVKAVSGLDSKMFGNCVFKQDVSVQDKLAEPLAKSMLPTFQDF